MPIKKKLFHLYLRTKQHLDKPIQFYKDVGLLLSMNGGNNAINTTGEKIPYPTGTIMFTAMIGMLRMILHQSSNMR
jgi:hypothetical protein